MKIWTKCLKNLKRNLTNANCKKKATKVTKIQLSVMVCKDC